METKKSVKCPKCGNVFPVLLDVETCEIVHSICENKDFLARVLKDSNTQSWSEEAREELARILSLIERMESLYK